MLAIELSGVPGANTLRIVTIIPSVVAIWYNRVRALATKERPETRNRFQRSDVSMQV